MTAVIYARYSSDNQREESIEGQIRECTAYAEKNGITIVKHYIDRAISAKTDNRPEFQQMIKDSDKKLFDIVLVWKLDRFARNRYDSARYKTCLLYTSYAFLIVIAGITILNIINSISMSVSARMKQYGILRAIGMDDAQLKRMISAEAGTYAVSGLVVGIALGLVPVSYTHLDVYKRQASFGSKLMI